MKKFWNQGKKYVDWKDNKKVLAVTADKNVAKNLQKKRERRFSKIIGS